MQGTPAKIILRLHWFTWSIHGAREVGMAVQIKILIMRILLGPKGTYLQDDYNSDLNQIKLGLIKLLYINRNH